MRITAHKTNMTINSIGYFVGATLLIVSMTCCTNHYLTKDMLSDQIITKEKLNNNKVSLYLPAGNIMTSFPIDYRSNNLKEILCYNDKGQKVYISVNKDTQLIVTDKKKQVHKFYLDTIFLNGREIQGLRSRIIGIKRSVAVEEIEKIEVYTELSKERLAE
jgi:hypothetical protein